MATKHSLPSYYLDSHRFNALMNQFGEYFERLSAIEKFELIAILAWWQSHDTEVQNSGGDPVSLEEYLDFADLPLQSHFDMRLPTALEILGECSEREALSLLVVLASQLKEGVFAQ
jgi:hypothetical protein